MVLCFCAVSFLVGCEHDNDHVVDYYNASGATGAEPVSEGAAAPGDPTAALQIVPQQVTLAAEGGGTVAGMVVHFIVEGGKPPYGEWKVSLPQLGSINPRTGVYVAASGQGKNVVSIADSAGAVATAEVEQTVSQATP